MNVLWMAVPFALAALSSPLAAGNATAGGTATLPFAFVDHRIALQVRIDGEGPYTMILDTGASATLAADDARALHLRTGRAFQMSGTGAGRTPAFESRVRSFDLGAGIVLHDIPATVVSLDELRRVTALPRLDGLIGTELLARYVVGIDYAQEKLTFRPPDGYTPDPGGVTVPLLAKRGTPVIHAGVDGLGGSFTIDTGDRVPLTLMEPFAKAHPALASDPAKVHGLTGWGFGGPVPGYVARVGRLDIGSLEIAGPLTRLPTVAGGFFTSTHLEGSIGTGVCEQFTVTFDVPHGRVTFAQRRETDDAYDRSGLFLSKRAGGLTVVDVMQHSPAERAALVPGDRVVALDGEPVDETSLGTVRAALAAPPGTAVTLRVERNGATLDVGLILADLA
ncbi:MAG: aspartyl protease family protein [Candidatus Baltobacteraceae bacterium]